MKRNDKRRHINIAKRNKAKPMPEGQRLELARNLDADVQRFLKKGGKVRVFDARGNEIGRKSR